MSDTPMTRERLAEIAAQLRAELPEGALDPRTIPSSAAPPPSFVEKLKTNPTWQALQAQLIDEAALLTWKLVSMNPDKGETREDFAHRLELLRGEIRGMMRVLDGPAVAHRAIEQRRER